MHEIGLCYSQILEMHQLHDSCTSYMTKVPVNLDVFSLKMHEMHQMHEIGICYAQNSRNAPGAPQLHELYYDSYSQS